MDANYFTTLREYREVGARVDELSRAHYNLQYDRHNSVCKNNPELDKLRRAAANATEAYRDALAKHLDAETDRLYDKLDNSDQVIILDNLFKKREQP
ncbi:MAG: hypothetical protein IKZ08_02460 [Bacteroidales bacterium]|nr:hypothetical protein [Bacteroidales bacterium]